MRKVLPDRKSRPQSPRAFKVGGIKMPPALHGGQTHDACAIPAIILQRKMPTNVESFSLTANLNAFSENLSFLRRVCAENEVTDILKFYRQRFGLSGNFLHRFHRKCLKLFKLQGSGRPELT